MDDLFNLVTSPWILVRDENCNEETVSIQDLFLKAHQFEAIAGETVTQNFAILRLLEAILSTILYRYDLNGRLSRMLIRKCFSSGGPSFGIMENFRQK